MVICVDSPDFNYNLAKKLKKNNYKNKIIQIVAPTVWAWRKGRAKKFSKVYDEIFTLFNFEKKFFENEGLKTTFIGHPISLLNSIDYEDPQEKNLIAFLPGSRENEINKLLPYFKIIHDYLLTININKYKLFIPTLPHLIDKITSLTNDWKIETIISKNSEMNTVYIYFIHIVFNATWSIIFFGLHNVFLALLTLILLISLIIILILRFRRVNMLSFYLMIPYLLWCCFALILNLNLFLLN